MHSAGTPLNLRSVLVALLALGISLPVAFLSLTKALIFIVATIYLITDLAVHRRPPFLERMHCVYVILGLVIFWGASLAWTGAQAEDALIAFVKHGKLLLIPILIFLLRDRRDTALGITGLLAGQTLVLVCSWLMAFGIAVPWVFRPAGAGNPLTQYVPYADSYLDQSIMLASTAGIAWHLASQYQGVAWRWLRWIAVAALANVLVLMPGRTGYLLAITTVCLAAVFELPARLRLFAVVVTPMVLGTALYVSVPQFQHRVSQAASELEHYEATPESQTSIGARLNMWKLSLRAIEMRPLSGYGVGNWTPIIKKIYGPGALELFGVDNRSNPHQEMLLWSVELGLGGGLLFVALLLALAFDSRYFQPHHRRAVLSLVVMLATTCLFNSPLYDDLLGDYFCVALGLLLALGLRDNPANKPVSAGTAVAP